MLIMIILAAGETPGKIVGATVREVSKQTDRQLRELLLLPTMMITSDQSNLTLEMSANAQRDGRPAEYRWRSLLNAAEFGSRPILYCRAVTLPRSEIR